jgi:hypothetical protein
VSSPLQRILVSRCGVVLLTFALALVADQSNARVLSTDDLMGRWCGDTSTYTFTPTELTVTFKRGEPRVLHIKSIELDESSINVFWVEAGNTIFSHFEKDTMVQDANTSGDKGPVRNFRRC